MKKFAAVIAMILAFAMVLAGCTTTPATEAPTTQAPTEAPTAAPTTPAPTEAPTEPAPVIEKGTAFDAFKEFHTEEDPDSVWQYYFFDPEDKSYNPMGQFIDHNDLDIHSWYPWEGSWVGVGKNVSEYIANYGESLELNADGPNGMRSILGFVAPADGEYVVTSKIANTYEQDCGNFTVRKDDGTVVVEVDYHEFIKDGYTWLDPTKVTLKAGEILYFEPLSNNDWVSAYAAPVIYYEPTDDSVMEKPESKYYEPDYPEVELGQTQGLYNAYKDLNKESATDGPWVYVITSDGVEFTPLAEYIEREWDDDPDPDACEWYMNADDYVGCGINADVEGLMEVNVEKSFEEGGRAAALGFKAPEDKTYSFTVYTRNEFDQDADKVVASLNGEVISEFPFNGFGNVKILDVELKAGETVYFYGVANGGDWVSAYMNVIVNECSAVGEFNRESATDGNWVYASTNDGREFSPAVSFDEPNWDDDPEADAAQWYSENGTGIGFNMDMAEWIEANVPSADSERMALGFKAPEDGKYELTVVSLNAWGQNGGDVTVSLNGEEVGTVPFLDVPFGKTFTVEMKAGEVVYAYGASNGDWVSCYLQVAVNKVTE